MVDRHDPAARTLCSGTGRAVRAVVVATVAVLLAVGCHVAAGGTPPPVATVAVVLAPATPLCFWLSDRAWSVSQLAATFFAVQAALHVLSLVTASDSVAHTSTVGMLAAHLVGTALTTAVVRHGERCLWATVDTLGLRALRMPTVPSLPAWHPLRQPADRADAIRTDQCARTVAPARGPPR